MLHINGYVTSYHPASSYYVLMVEDSIGFTEIVRVSLLVNESKETIEWLIDSFKRNNNIQGLRVVMADKHITERNVIKGRLNAPVLFTYFML